MIDCVEAVPALKKVTKWERLPMVVDPEVKEVRLDSGLCWHWQADTCVSRFGLRSRWVTSCFSPMPCSSCGHKSIILHSHTNMQFPISRSRVSYLKGERQGQRRGPPSWEKYCWLWEAPDSRRAKAAFPGHSVFEILIFSIHRSSIYSAGLRMWDMDVQSHGSQWFVIVFFFLQRP